MASIICAGTTRYFFRVYGAVHWSVLNDHYKELNDGTKNALLAVLQELEVYRLFALLSFAFAIWAVCSKPRWVGVLCFLPALAALSLALTVM